MDGSIRLWDNDGRLIGRPIESHLDGHGIEVPADGRSLIGIGEGEFQAMDVWDLADLMHSTTLGQAGYIQARRVARRSSLTNGLNVCRNPHRADSRPGDRSPAWTAAESLHPRFLLRYP